MEHATKRRPEMLVVGVRLDSDTVARLQQIAREDDRTLSALIRRTLLNVVKKQSAGPTR